MVARINASKMAMMPSFEPVRSKPRATKALSWGQTDPLWYDIGLYRASLSAIVRTPQPEKKLLSRSCAAT